MGDYFNIDSEDSETITGVFDDMLTEFGSPCKVIYTSTETICPNCIINPRTGESTNRYKEGGPVPFPLGEVCPVCNGKGRISGTASSDVLVLVIDWMPKPWFNLDGEASNLIRIPAGMVATRGFVTDISKILRSDYVILDTNNKFILNKYKLYGQPYVLGALTGNRYFLAVWKKVE